MKLWFSAELAACESTSVLSDTANAAKNDRRRMGKADTVMILLCGKRVPGWLATIAAGRTGDESRLL
jgi:hypothetical protein